MALVRLWPPSLGALLPATNGTVRPIINVPFLHRLSQPIPALSTPLGLLALPFLPIISIPSLNDIWNGILNAVPKKKTSYRKKRQRFLAGKALKDITSLNRCSGCGRTKRLHLLCPYCVDVIKTNFFGQREWSWRKPGWKEVRNTKGEELRRRQRNRGFEPDPRKEAEKQIIKHTGWKR